MERPGIIGRMFGRRKSSPPRSSEAQPGPATPEPPSAPAQQGGNPHEDLERAARGFVEEHEPLLAIGDPDVLTRVFVQGANVFNSITPENVEAANRAAAAKRALAAAIGDPATPALKLQEIKDEEALASRLNDSLSAASRELGDFLERVHARLPERSR